jgi:hypothetical protein
MYLAIQNKLIILFWILISTLGFTPTLAISAELEVINIEVNNTYAVPSYPNIRLRLSGEIQVGDARKLSDFISEKLPKYYPSSGSSITLSLNSEGGSFEEGIALLNLAKEHAIETVVEGDSRCISACALAFLGGTGVNDGSLFFTSRTVYPGGELGFHAPSLDLTGESLVPVELMQDSYAQALAALGSLMKVADSFDIPLSLLQKIVETPPSDIYVLRTVEDFARWKISTVIDDTGWVPNREEIARLCMNFDIWANDGSVFGPSDFAPNDKAGRKAFEGELAGKMQFDEADRTKPISTVYAYVQTLQFEYDEHCVVGILAISVNKTNGSPQATIQGLREANIIGNRATRLHALPPDFEISNLPPVNYP